MKPCTIKPLLAALLLAGSCAAQAAHFEVVSYMGFAGYSGTANGESFSDEAIDASSLLDGDVAFFGANVFSANGIDHAYAADASFFKAGQNFSMSVSQSLTSPFGTTFSADTLVSMPSLKLKIVGDGEAVGSNVSISFAVESTAFNTYALNGGSLTMDFAFTGPDDSTTSALFDFSSESMRTESFTLGFTGKVGDEFQLSGNMMSSLNADGLQAINASASGQLVVNFTITAVPEPEQYAMLLAGLGLVAGVARRRR